MNPSIHPSSAAASAAADAASVLRSPCQCGSVLGFRFRIQRQSSSGRPTASGTPRVLAAGQGTPSSGLRRTRRSLFSGGPRSCAALDRRCGCPHLRLEWREVSGGGWVPGPPAASCSSAPSDSLAGRSPRQSVKQTQLSAKIRIFTACKGRSSGDLKHGMQFSCTIKLIGIQISKRASTYLNRTCCHQEAGNSTADDTTVWAGKRHTHPTRSTSCSAIFSWHKGARQRQQLKASLQSK
jgi:hypothetical protein